VQGVTVGAAVIVERQRKRGDRTPLKIALLEVLERSMTVEIVEGMEGVEGME
jgi:hypothetical protein